MNIFFISRTNTFSVYLPVLSYRADMDAVAFLEMDIKLPER